MPRSISRSVGLVALSEESLKMVRVGIILDLNSSILVRGISFRNDYRRLYGAGDK